MKQETLEEAAEKYANKKGDIPTTNLEDAIFKQGFIDGAKWQQQTVQILLDALTGIEKICDNQNHTHEQIWRIAYAALQDYKKQKGEL